MNIRDVLTRHEGYRNMLYEDTEGNLTIGVGYHIGEKGLPDYIIQQLLTDSIKEAREELDRVRPNWKRLNPARQNVLVNMMFNLGAPAFLTFEKFWHAMRNDEFSIAADEMLNSKWAKQVGNRAIELANIMRAGK